MYKIINKVSELPNFDKSLPVFADIETGGLYTEFRMVQFLQPQTDNLVYILDIAQIGYNEQSYKEELCLLKDFIMKHHTVWYNASYDLGTLNISPSIVNGQYVSKVDDLYYAVKSAYAEFQDFGLKKIVKKLRYVSGLYDSTREDHGTKGFPKGSYTSKSAYIYAATDVIALSKIWEDRKVQNVIERNTAYKVDMASQAYALIYQQNGLKLNREAWIKELNTAKENVVKYTKLLPVGFNPNSFKQVRELLNIEKSDREALTILSMEDSKAGRYAGNIIKLKRYKKQVSYLNSINYDNMVTKFNVAGAITGRFTSAGGDIPNGFNAQQIPRDFQYLFNSPTDTTSVVDADYSTLELRLAAAIFNEVNMYKLLKDGKDLHTSMAVNISGKKVGPNGVIKVDTNFRDVSNDYEFITSNDRQNAKVVNFGFVFSMSAVKFMVYAKTSYGITYTKEEAEDMRKKYFNLYPTIGKYHNKVWKLYKNPGFFVYTALGRKIKPKLGTDAINVPVQGSGAETTKLAVHYLVKDNPELDILSWIYNVVHDAIYLRVPKGMEDIASNVLNKAMIKGWTEISKTSLFNFKDIPMIAEVEVHK